MSKFITISADRKELLDLLLKLTEEELSVFFRFSALYRAESTKEMCEAFADFIQERNTGLPISELAAFCDKIEKEFLRKVAAV